MIRPTELTSEEFAEIARWIPGPEPSVRRSKTPGGRFIPVCETLLDGNELAYLTECVTSNWISSAGPFVKRFESEFAKAAGCAHGVACSSGTAALHLALATLGIGPGDEVIMPAFTMVATANAARYLDAKPVLVDAEPVTGNMDPSRIEEKVGPRTRAIVVVHTYGHPADMDPILAIARRRGLAVVEDAAEAHGALYRGRPVGSLGDLACFSFYGNKIVSTGEGGMVVTEDEATARVVRRLRDHAFSEERHFWHKYLGYNYRMTNLQAAVGVAQTERLAAFVEKRRANALRYSARLKDVPGLTLPAELPWARSVFWMYGIRVGDSFGATRDELRGRLADAGIETRSFFIPIHLQPIYFREHRGESYPVAEELCRTGLYLPSGPGLSLSDLDFVAAEIERAGMRVAAKGGRRRKPSLGAS
jgi:perosamine synthetase